MSLNFGQTTSNIVESHNQKIKAILKKRSNMAVLVRKLLMLHECKNTAIALRNFNSTVKVRYITNNDDPIVREILNETTTFVGGMLRVQYNWAMEKASVQDSLPDNFDCSSCPCRFFRSFLLPCSHMLLGRLKEGKNFRIKKGSISSISTLPFEPDFQCPFVSLVLLLFLF